MVVRLLILVPAAVVVAYVAYRLDWRRRRRLGYVDQPEPLYVDHGRDLAAWGPFEPDHPVDLPAPPYAVQYQIPTVPVTQIVESEAREEWPLSDAFGRAWEAIDDVPRFVVPADLEDDPRSADELAEAIAEACRAPVSDEGPTDRLPPPVAHDPGTPDPERRITERRRLPGLDDLEAAIRETARPVAPDRPPWFTLGTPCGPSPTGRRRHGWQRPSVAGSP